ncbi:putative galacturonosyltransferase 15 [Forsythia ovata]|uniref:Hexosyltransferase n=1 Tax=Forsythia ovata TaxID=205694 RepID=A0ABD1QCU5_9LAMI
MKLYVSTTRLKRVSIPGAAASRGGGERFWQVMKGKISTQTAVNSRICHRTVVMPAILLLGLLLPFLFVRIAFLVLESATVCSSSIGNFELREELTRALLEATNSIDDESGIATVEGSKSLLSFEDLVRDTMSNRQDIKTFAFKTKAIVLYGDSYQRTLSYSCAKCVILNMERMVQMAKRRESIYWHLASHGVPRCIHCLSLKLAEEYAVNAVARSCLPPLEFVSCLTDPSFHHVVLLTDNVLAASVVISSTINTSLNPEKLVFHVVTDKKTYTSMHAWFAVNTIDSAVVEVKGLHQYDWSHEINVGVKEMLEIHHQIRNNIYRKLKEEDLEYEEEHDHKLEVLSPSCISLLNHLRIYLPELFPDLNKVVFLDDDIVVQHDLSSLWDLDLNEKVVGAVFDSWCGHDCCPGRKYKNYFNFSNPVISSNLDYDRCGWLYGMNVFDLQMWRKTNITAVYHQWLKLSLNSGFILWHPGALPPALIAFEGYVHRIDPSWHVAGLGFQYPQVDKYTLEAAAVIHFSGPAKPWLEIGDPEVKGLWNRHVNFSNEYIRKCRVMG